MCRSDPVDCAHLMATVILSYKYSPKTEIPFRAVHACQTSRGASSQMQVCCARKNRAIYDACVHTRTWRGRESLAPTSRDPENIRWWVGIVHYAPDE